MTNQNFRIEAKELLRMVHLYETTAINSMSDAIINNACEAIKKAILYIPKYEQALSECESKLNEAIEMAKFYADEEKIFWRQYKNNLDHPRAKAQEFLNKISYKEEL